MGRGTGANVGNAGTAWRLGRMAVLGAGLSAWACAAPAAARSHPPAPAIGEIGVQAEGGLYSIGVRAFVHGDPSPAATLQLFYRFAGSAAPFDTGMVMVRRRGSTTWAARLLFLEPGDRVEYFIEARDPPSGQTVRTPIDSAATRKALHGPAAGAPEFYVATSGSDTSSGGRERPFRTLARARAALVRANAASQEGGTIALIGPGEWHESLALDFGSPMRETGYAVVGIGDPDSIVIDGSYEPAARNGYVDATHPLEWAATSADSVYAAYFPAADSVSGVTLGFGETLHPKTSMSELTGDAMGERSGWLASPGGDTLYVKRANGASPAGLALHAGYLPYAIYAQRRFTYVSNLTIRFTGGPEGWGFGIKLGGGGECCGASNSCVSGVRFVGLAGTYGIGVFGTRYSDSVVVEHCRYDGLTIGAMEWQASKFRQQGRNGLASVSGRDWTLFGNEARWCFDFVTTNDPGSTPADTIPCADEEVIDNVADGMRNSSLELGRGSSAVNALLLGNIARHVGGAGIVVDATWVGPEFVLDNLVTPSLLTNYTMVRWGSSNHVRFPSNAPVLLAHNTLVGAGTGNTTFGASGQAGELHGRDNVLIGAGTAWAGGGSIFQGWFDPSVERSYGVAGEPDTLGQYRSDFDYDVIDSLPGSKVLAQWQKSKTYSLGSLRANADGFSWEQHGIVTSIAFADSAHGDWSLREGGMPGASLLRLPGIDTPCGRHRHPVLVPGWTEYGRLIDEP